MRQAPPGQRPYFAIHLKRLAVLVQILGLKRPNRLIGSRAKNAIWL
jgi:hypothetical protein